MTLPPAALPGHQYPQAPSTFVPHPGTRALLGCPACGHPTSLAATYVVETVVPVEVAYLPATSVPEVEPVAAADTADPANWQQPTKLQCTACRWAYTGPDALGKLVQT